MDRVSLRQSVLDLAASNKERYVALRKAAEEQGRSLWLHANSGVVCPAETPPNTLGSEPWLLVKAALSLQDLVRAPLSAMQMIPNRLNSVVGGPTPLATMLAGGLLGAGTGYLGGRLLEYMAPEGTLEKGRARATLAMLGGLTGTLPGAWMGSIGMRKPRTDGSSPWRSWVEPNPIYPRLKSSVVQDIEDGVKEAALAIEPFVPDIPVDRFNQVIWSDPYTPMPIRAAVGGLLDAASDSRGGVRYVSPADIGRIAIGAGAGAGSAILVGKTLGALAGLTSGAQEKLKDTGLWAGALLNAIPLLFR